MPALLVATGALRHGESLNNIAGQPAQVRIPDINDEFIDLEIEQGGIIPEEIGQCIHS